MQTSCTVPLGALASSCLLSGCCNELGGGAQNSVKLETVEVTLAL